MKFPRTIGGKLHEFMNINDHPHPFRFNRENARENAAKSWQARRQRKAKLETEAQQGRQSTPQSERLALQIKRIHAVPSLRFAGGC